VARLRRPKTLREPVDAGRRVAAGIVDLEAPLLQELGPADGIGIGRFELVERELTPVGRQMGPEALLRFVALDVRRLILEVEERPELEAGIRDRNADAFSLGFPARILKPRVLVDVEDAPDFVEPKELVACTSRQTLSLPLPSSCLLYDVPRPALARLNLDQVESCYPAQGEKVPPLRDLAFADDEKPAFRLPSRRAATQRRWVNGYAQRRPHSARVDSSNGTAP
jgi:hypothetical protein